MNLQPRWGTAMCLAFFKYFQIFYNKHMKKPNCTFWWARLGGCKEHLPDYISWLCNFLRHWPFLPSRPHLEWKSLNRDVQVSFPPPLGSLRPVRLWRSQRLALVWSDQVARFLEGWADFPGFPGGSVNLPVMQEMPEMWVRFLGWEDPLEEGTAIHCSILAWRVPCTEEPGGLQVIDLKGWTRLKRLGIAHSTALYPPEPWAFQNLLFSPKVT